MKIPDRQIAPVSIEPYDLAWPQQFNELRGEIMAAAGDYIRTIEHIGSTAVPGLDAKPEIDILIGTDTLLDADQLVERLEPLGYRYYRRFEEFEPERRYFRKSSGIVPLVHIHAVCVGSSGWVERLAFRDLLRSNPEEAAAYAGLKHELIDQNGSDRGAYSDGKEAYVAEVTKRALNQK